jgi:hypothetical protein
MAVILGAISDDRIFFLLEFLDPFLEIDPVND